MNNFFGEIPKNALQQAKPEEMRNSEIVNTVILVSLAENVVNLFNEPQDEGQEYTWKMARDTLVSRFGLKSQDETNAYIIALLTTLNSRVQKDTGDRN